MFLSRLVLRAGCGVRLYRFLIIVFYLRFSKAFDNADHQRLILKLLRIGMRSQVVYWIQSFLNETTQKDIDSGDESSECRVQSGVPRDPLLDTASS